MYCLTCKRLFNDIHEVHDTRTDEMFMDRCPYCLSFYTVNAVRILTEYLTTIRYTNNRDKLYIREALISKLKEEGMYNETMKRVRAFMKSIKEVDKSVGD